MKTYCTITDVAYLPRVTAQYKSMLRHCGDFRLIVMALNDESAALARKRLAGADIILVDEIMTHELEAARSSRGWREFVWTLKPALIAHVLLSYSQSVAYVDGDGYFFSSDAPMFAEIDGAALAVTPHRFPARLAKYLVNGRYNGGFVYATRDGLATIQRWAEQCAEWCYLRYDGGRFVDQKYLDEWKAHDVQHIGVNCAPWNQEQYAWRRDGGAITLNGTPLIWYHFHQGLRPAYPLNDFVKNNVYKEYEAELCGCS